MDETVGVVNKSGRGFQFFALKLASIEYGSVTSNALTLATPIVMTSNTQML